MKLSLIRFFATGAVAVGMAAGAQAQQEVKEITGAGATFPAPLYAK
mgnify:FL=1